MEIGESDKNIEDKWIIKPADTPIKYYVISTKQGVITEKEESAKDLERLSTD